MNTPWWAWVEVCMSDVKLSRRVDALESELRRTRRVALAALVGLVALPLLALGPGASLLRADRVEARELVVVDDAGEVLVSIGATERGGMVLVRDASGEAVVELGAREGTTRVMRLAGAAERAQRDGAPNDVMARPEDEPAEFGGVDLRPLEGATSAQVERATALAARGWVYVMPAPKSSSASWESTDSRTTWFNGYWMNTLTERVSTKEPGPNDGWQGDGIRPAEWRRGGAPRRPTVIEWLCSNEGGVEPKE